MVQKDPRAAKLKYLYDRENVTRVALFVLLKQRGAKAKSKNKKQNEKRNKYTDHQEMLEDTAKIQLQACGFEGFFRPDRQLPTFILAVQ